MEVGPAEFHFVMAEFSSSYLFGEQRMADRRISVAISNTFNYGHCCEPETDTDSVSRKGQFLAAARSIQEAGSRLCDDDFETAGAEREC